MALFAEHPAPAVAQDARALVTMPTLSKRTNIEITENGVPIAEVPLDKKAGESTVARGERLAEAGHAR